MHVSVQPASDVLYVFSVQCMSHHLLMLAAAVAEWEEKRRLAVERQQAKLREGTAAFLQKQMEENEREKVTTATVRSA
jgi:hypothetical protein